MLDFLLETFELGGKTAAGILGVSEVELTYQSPAVIVGEILKVVLGLLGVIFTVLVIWGAIKWMLSRGEEEQVKGAKDLIINATIGLALAVAGYTLTVLIIDVILRSVIGQPLVSP